MQNEFIIRDFQHRRWRRFCNPIKIVAAYRLKDVVPALEAIEAMVNKQGLHAAGFISYEASPAFDQALTAHASPSFPLLWFGLYKKSTTVRFPIVNSESSSPLHWKKSITSDFYKKAIHRIKKHIAAGDCYQINYTYRLRSPFKGSSKTLFHHMVEAQGAPYAAYLDTKDFSILSASPELFFSLNGKDLVSRPMKGTSVRGLTPSEDQRKASVLFHSEKERAENIMIVDMVRNDMGRVAIPGSVRVPQKFALEKYPTVWQMTSTVQAKTKASLPGIIKALFPPASVTGAPKLRVSQIISSLEPTPRLVYTGAMGFWGPKRQAQFNVAIRTVMIDKKKKRAEFGVGSGVVWDSKEKNEFDECKSKAAILSVRRPPFSLLETLLWKKESGYFLLNLHVARLKSSAAYFDFIFDEKRLRRILISSAARWNSPRRVRLLLSKAGDFKVQNSEFKPPSQSLVKTISLSRTPVNSGDVFLYHKTTHRKIYDEKRFERPQSDDVLLWNERGELTESCIANVAVRLKGKLVTPPVFCGLLAGTYREYLLKKGILTEKVIRLSDLKHQPILFLFNSVRGMEEVRLNLRQG